MDTFQALREQARQNRAKAIKAAQVEYREAVREIRRIHHALNGTPPAKPRKLLSKHLLPKAKNYSMHGWMAIRAAEAVLRERGPLTLVEIVVAMQANGCRTLDDPRRILRTVSTSFAYHSGKFRCDADKRWSMAGL